MPYHGVVGYLDVSELTKIGNASGGWRGKHASAQRLGERMCVWLVMWDSATEETDTLGVSSALL